MATKNIDLVRIEMLEANIEIEEIHGFTVVAKIGEQLVGSCRLGDWNQPAAIITTLSVVKEYRRRRIATHMIWHCWKAAKAAGKESLSLSVARKNEPAIALYKKLGFRITWTASETLYMTLLVPQAVDETSIEAFKKAYRYVEKPAEVASAGS